MQTLKMPTPISRGEYFSFYWKLFPDGHFYPTKLFPAKGDIFTILLLTCSHFERPLPGKVSLTTYDFPVHKMLARSWKYYQGLLPGKGFPALERFPCLGKVSLCSKFFCQGKFSLHWICFLLERFPCQGKVPKPGKGSLSGKVSLTRKGFPALEWQFPTTRADNRIEKLFP